MDSNADQAPSLISGHAQYAKGYVEETIGNVTGSEEWKQSGKGHTQQGIDEMKAASQQREKPQSNTAMGQVEEMAGRATGCEGMEEEGKLRQDKHNA